MAYDATPIAHTTAHSTDNANVTTSGINTTGSDLIVLSINFNGALSITVSDSKTNTWTAGAANANAPSQQFYYCQAPTVGSGHTFSVSGPAFSLESIQVQAWHGSVATPLDQHSHAFNAAATSLAPGSITPSENNELVITGVGFDGNFGTSATVNGGFTITDTDAGGAAVSFGGGMAYLVQTTAAAANPTWTGNVGSGGVSAGVTSFKAAAGVATTKTLAALGVG